MASKTRFAKSLLALPAPPKVTAASDFYTYVNHHWLKQTHLNKQQQYIVQVDDFRLAQDKVYHQLTDLAVRYAKKNRRTPLGKNLANYLASVRSMTPVAESRRLSREAVQTVDEFIRKDNVWALLAHLNQDEMIADHLPFTWSLQPDDKNPTVFRSHISSARFMLLDLNVYFDDGTDVAYKKHYRAEYVKYLTKLFATTLGETAAAEFVPKDCYDAQVDMFTALGCDDVTSKTEPYYNKVDAADALPTYGFDWPEFARQLGFARTPGFFVTSSRNYLKCGAAALLQNWKTPKWRTFWVYLILRKLARITAAWEHITFDFYGKFERGQTEIVSSPAVRCALYLSVPFNTLLRDLYVANYADPRIVEYTKILCNDLKRVFHRILLRNTWMQPATKRAALEKLAKFEFIYGTVDNTLGDPVATYTRSLHDNLQKVSAWRHRAFVRLEGERSRPVPAVDWSQYPVKLTGTQAYIVNASYTPSKNAIFINMGYLQSPFVELNERGIEYNLAHLGFTIGHEMSHGFDDMGSQYDASGKLADWWTPKDKQKFKAIQADVVRQYEEFAARDGVKFDASIGIGEDLADISGLAICDEYLHDFQEANDYVLPARALSFETFYTHFAYQQKQQVGKKALSAQLKTNPHPLDKYRCNIPLSRSAIFRALYGVKPRDDMWWHNTATVW